MIYKYATNMFYSISLELELENVKDSLDSSTSKASVFYQREHGKFKIENTNINTITAGLQKKVNVKQKTISKNQNNIFSGRFTSAQTVKVKQKTILKPYPQF